MGDLGKLREKVVLITGAAGGIGSLLSRRLFDAGCKLILVDRNREGLERLLNDLGDGARVTIRALELSSSLELDDLARNLGDGPLHVLINNAGLAPGGTFGDMTLQQLRRVIRVNLEAVLGLTHRLLPLLKASAPAHIVNVASAAGLLAPGGMAAYAASKFGLVGFSEALRSELRGSRVGVSVVCPGFVNTDIVLNSFAERDQLPEGERRRIAGLDELVKANGIDPQKVVRAVIKAIRCDRARIVLGGRYRAAIALRFFFPGLADWLNARNYKKLKSKGLL